MNPILKNVLVFIAGAIIGSIVNMGIVSVGPNIIPPPEGINPADFESLKANFHLLQPRHFIMPFLAHAIGTLAGAFFVAKFAASHHMRMALLIGVFFLVGGILMVVTIPETPIWFAALDLIVAYLPMAWLGWKLGSR